MTHFVFYLRGPRAYGLSQCWWGLRSRKAERNDWHSGEHVPGCHIARKVGATIPNNTYFKAEPKFSQNRRWRGMNDTAILPLEVD